MVSSILANPKVGLLIVDMALNVLEQDQMSKVWPVSTHKAFMLANYFTQK